MFCFPLYGTGILVIVYVVYSLRYRCKNERQRREQSGGGRYQQHVHGEHFPALLNTWIYFPNSDGMSPTLSY